MKITRLFSRILMDENEDSYHLYIGVTVLMVTVARALCHYLIGKGQMKK